MRWMVLGLMIGGVAQAGDDPQLTAKYRGAMMRGVGAHMGQIGLVLKGKIDRKDDLLYNALAIQAAAERYRTLFPEGTDPEHVKTEALPTVWKKPAEFKTANETWLKASQGLVKALQSKKSTDTEIKAAWGSVGKACGGCHDTFKADD